MLVARLVALPLLLTTVDGPVQPKPDFSGPGLAALSTIGGWVAAALLVVAIVVGLVGALLIVVGQLAKIGDLKTWGWRVVIGALVGVVVGGGIAGLVTLAQTLKIV